MTSSNDLSEFEWLTEPTDADPTWAEPDEGYTDWLARSTLWRAQATREFLRYNLSELPAAWRRNLCRDLETRWETAFFELIVARTLQALGCRDPVVEQPSEDGKAPDFKASFAEGPIIVEATSPEFFREEDLLLKRIEVLNSIIEKATPAGWSVVVEELPDIGPSDSKREFKRKVAELMRLPPPSMVSAPRRLSRETSSGRIVLYLIRRKPGPSSIVMGPAIVTNPDAVPRIQRTVKKERRQVRNAGCPVVLAVNGRWNAPTEDFDRALFSSESAARNNMDEVASKLVADGEFAVARNGEPTYAALLAYPDAFVTCRYEPILYIHPRFSGQLPDSIRVLQTRCWVDGRVEVTPAKRPRVLAALNPVDLSKEPRAETPSACQPLPPMKKEATDRRGERGIFERPPGSGTWWIRYADEHGRMHREKTQKQGVSPNSRRGEIGRFPFSGPAGVRALRRNPNSCNEVVTSLCPAGRFRSSRPASRPACLARLPSPPPQDGERAETGDGVPRTQVVFFRERRQRPGPVLAPPQQPPDPDRGQGCGYCCQPEAGRRRYGRRVPNRVEKLSEHAELRPVLLQASPDDEEVSVAIAGNVRKSLLVGRVRVDLELDPDRLGSSIEQLAEHA
jgi:hypothetical protein